MNLFPGYLLIKRLYAKYRYEIYKKLKHFFSVCRRIMPGWQKWTYCNGLKTADYNTWREIWHNTSRIYKENDYKMLKFFSCSEDPKIIINYLKFFIPTFETYENIYISTLARHARNTTMLTEIMNNFEHIQNR